MTITIVQGRRIYEEIVVVLKEKAGTRYTINELAKKLNVGRSRVYNALKRLWSDDIIQSKNTDRGIIYWIDPHHV